MAQFNEFPPTEERPKSAAAPGSFMDKIKNSLKMDSADSEAWRIVSDFPKAHIALYVVVAILNLFLPGIGTILLGILGRPFSKIQVFLGILQFFIWPWFLRYIWVIGWTVLIFVRYFQARKAGAVEENPKGAYDINSIEQNNHRIFS
eukprot:TRINITY_DN6989_c0_g2_i1.p1 TRINITY_DN6989_c0_g2~~TRINITY_DN6989_c0_g2_i1.p1  ORF type:complete len:147 (+),score=7.39 TRINITY_DN6989_c0_g2_i1:106-546(+)